MAQTKICYILFKQNSPYGTYVADDYVDIYWDDSTNQFVVKKNGGVITSGNEIPQYFTYGGFPEVYYKLENIIQVSICQGDDLWQYERVSTFPYYIRVKMKDHPTCSLFGEVCDLAFDSLPVITNASTSTASDGSIVVSASGSNGSVKYRLEDFEYNDGYGQTSGTFSGLHSGTYTVYCRDAKNCLAVISVKVGVTSTYGVLYRLEFYDHRLNYHNKTEVLQKDYSGSVTEVIAGNADPTIYTLRGEGERDKFVSILAGQMVFCVMSQSDFQFSTLYTNDPEKFRLRHSIDDGGGYDIQWIGKVVANQYEEAYISPPYPLNITATDGLPSLADEVLLDDDGNPLNGDYKQIVLIAWILNKIGFGINIHVACNMYATGMSTGANNDPLDQAYVDVSRYYLLSESPTCYDVLKMILEPYGAQIILYNNVWNILRVEERVNSFDYRVFNSLGVYVSNSTYNPVKDLKRSSDIGRIVWTDSNQNLRIYPGFGKIRLLYNLGRKKNLLVNGDFRLRKTAGYQANVKPIVFDDSGSQVYLLPDLNGFQLVTNGIAVTQTYQNLEDGNVAVGFITNEPGAYLLSDTYTLKMGGADTIKVTYIFRHLISSFGAGAYIRARLKVTYGTYYLKDDGTWTTTDTSIVFFIKGENYNKYQKLEIVAAPPSVSALDGMAFNVKCYIAHDDSYEWDNITLFRAKQTTTLPANYRTEFYDSAGTYDITGGSNPFIYYYELKNDTNAESVPNIVRPDDYNGVTNPYQWILQSYSPVGGETNTFYIDLISVEVLNAGKLLPEVADFSQSMENENKQVLEKIIYHGSITYNGVTNYNLETIYKQVASQGLIIKRDSNVVITNEWLKPLLSQFVANTADIAYIGYLRNSSGTGFTTWSRDAFPEAKTLEQVFADMYSSQYNAPWRSLSGGFTGDILFTPIDTMRETMDSNRKYYAPSLEIHYKANEYNAEFTELTDIASTGSLAVGVGYSLGFTIGFDS